MSLSSQQASASSSQFLWLPVSAAVQNGATGPTGSSPPGPQGPIGSPTGEAGPTGNNGTQGVVGLPGANGVSVVGPAGPVGATGPVGLSGATGATGARGATGGNFNIIFTDSNITLANNQTFDKSYANNGTLVDGIYAVALDCSLSPARNMYQEFYLQTINTAGTFNSFVTFVAGNNIGNTSPSQLSRNFPAVLDPSNIVRLAVVETQRNTISLINGTSNASDNYTMRTFLISPYPF